MSNSPYEPSFDGERGVLEQMRGRCNHASKAPSACADNRGRRHAMIAEAAYYRAERRGFDPGHELEDWLAAEAELKRSLAPGSDKGNHA